jgi:spermidine synthase
MHSATWFRYPVPLHLSRSHCVVPALSAMVTSTLGTVTASSFRYRRLKSVLVAVAAVSALASAELKACVRCDSGPANTAGRFSTLWSCELEQGGYLSVVQVTKTFASHATSSRYECLLMRLDHAIMGGTWLLPAHVAGRPVYSAFHLQTAARLFASPANTDQRRSLHVGLGAGAGVAALQRHGFATDVIELHPEIIDAAERFFGVNVTHQSGSSIAGDAAQVLPTTVPAGKYDVVLLDTFSGEGDAAASVNSVRFFREISRVMVAKPRQRTGVLAVNIVGTQASDLTTVACRIAHVFQHLRCFAAETEDNDARRKRSAIRNFVIFASQSDYLKGVQINAATVKQQHARLTADDAAVEEEMLGDMASREIQLDTRRATCASLEGSNRDGGGAALTRALHHWKTMRDQFHGGFWES